MNILITPRLVLNEKLGPLWAIEDNYLKYFKPFVGSNNLVVPSPYSTIDSKLISSDSRIILTGGGDVGAKLYGKTSTNPSAESEERDKYEYSILDFAVANNIPVLGICRGMQLMNVYFGGSLIQDLRSGYSEFDHVGAPHKITLHDKQLSSKLSNVHAATTEVNSYHNQGISSSELAKDLKFFATSNEGKLIEGIYHSSLPIAGVIWHPERGGMPQDLNKVLIENFLAGQLFWKTSV